MQILRDMGNISQQENVELQGARIDKTLSKLKTGYIYTIRLEKAINCRMES